MMLYFGSVIIHSKRPSGAKGKVPAPTSFRLYHGHPAPLDLPRHLEPGQQDSIWPVILLWIVDLHPVPVYRGQNNGVAAAFALCIRPEVPRLNRYDDRVAFSNRLFQVLVRAGPDKDIPHSK